MKEKKLLSKQKILISVVVPAYNEEKLLTSCLKTLKKQNFPALNYEIILVNNASTDKTAEIGKKLGVKVVFEPKKGLTFALKRGFSQAKGEIIAITDADTIVNPDWLKNIFSVFQKNSDIVLVGGRTIFKPVTVLSFLAERVINFGCCFLKMANGANMALRRKVYEKLGLNESISFNWENDLSLRAKKEGKIYFLWDNPVITSSRHFKGKEGIRYCLKGLINGICVCLLKKTVFYHFDDVRE